VSREPAIALAVGFESACGVVRRAAVQLHCDAGGAEERVDLVGVAVEDQERVELRVLPAAWAPGEEVAEPDLEPAADAAGQIDAGEGRESPGARAAWVSSEEVSDVAWRDEIEDLGLIEGVGQARRRDEGCEVEEGACRSGDLEVVAADPLVVRDLRAVKDDVPSSSYVTGCNEVDRAEDTDVPERGRPASAEDAVVTAVEPSRHEVLA
jgi:hypothetical protein